MYCLCRAAAKKMKQGVSYPLGDGGLFGALVKSVSGKGEGRECNTCHRVSPLKKMLLNSPDLGEFTYMYMYIHHVHVHACTCEFAHLDHEVEFLSTFFHCLSTLCDSVLYNVHLRMSYNVVIHGH